MNNFEKACNQAIKYAATLSKSLQRYLEPLELLAS